MTTEEKRKPPQTTKHKRGRKRKQKDWYFDDYHYTPLWLEAVSEECSPIRRDELREELLTGARDVAQGVIRKWGFHQWEREDDLIQEAMFKVLKDFHKFGKKPPKPGQRLSAHTYLTTIIKNHLFTYIHKARRIHSRTSPLEVLGPDGNIIDNLEILSFNEDFKVEELFSTVSSDDMIETLKKTELGILMLEFLGYFGLPEEEEERKLTFKALFAFAEERGYTEKECKSFLKKLRRIYKRRDQRPTRRKKRNSR